MMATLRRLVGWEAFLAVMTLGLVAYGLLAVPTFATTFNISQAIAGASERALMVLPMALLIIAREIDLSIASTLALASVVFGVAIEHGASPGAAVGVALACGALCGALNGGLVTRLGLPSLVVTLGTLAMFRGVGYIILGPDSVNTFPDSVTDFGIDTVGDGFLPWTILPFLGLAPVFLFVLQRSAVGRRIYAIGGSPAVALYSGVRVDRIRFGLFVVTGMVSAIAGVVFTARVANARADNALGLELDVITTVLLGGISVFGGRGTLTGVFWALMLIAIVRNLLGLQHIGGDIQSMTIGLLLIGSLLLSTTSQRLLGWLRSSRPATPSTSRGSGGASMSHD